MRSSDGYATGYNPSGQRSPVPYMQQSGDAVDACATPLQSISSASVLRSWYTCWPPKPGLCWFQHEQLQGVRTVQAHATGGRMRTTRKSWTSLL